MNRSIKKNRLSPSLVFISIWNKNEIRQKSRHWVKNYQKERKDDRDGIDRIKKKPPTFGTLILSIRFPSPTEWFHYRCLALIREMEREREREEKKEKTIINFIILIIFCFHSHAYGWKRTFKFGQWMEQILTMRARINGQWWFGHSGSIRYELF